MLLNEDFYIGLLFECPFNSENEDCPYKSIRLLDIKQRIELHNKNLTIDLISIHVECLRKREGDKMVIKDCY